jgi:hypothetical protein
MASVAEFPTRRPSRIHEMPRYRVVLRDFRMWTGGDWTGWLGWQDSKLCIPNDRIEPEGFRREAEKG